MGDTLIANGQPLTIVGVAPAGFSGTTVGVRPDVFVPLTLRWLLDPTMPREQTENRLSCWLYLFGRLRPGVSMEQAAASLNTLYRGIINDVEAPLDAMLSGPDLERFRQKQITLAPGARGQSDLPRLAAQPMALLLGVTALVLLIACFNVANLLLAQGACGRDGHSRLDRRRPRPPARAGPDGGARARRGRAARSACLLPRPRCTSSSRWRRSRQRCAAS
ncbi:MAG TPA: ABC transporter permease [Gammaproteobacteria bacterium]